MPSIQTLATRVTSRYIDAYAHLDDWGQSFKFKFLAPKLIAQGHGYDEGDTVSQRIIGSKTADQDAQIKALRDNLNHFGCSHEWDCCGCPSTSAQIRRVRKGVFTAILSTSYNY